MSVYLSGLFSAALAVAEVMTVCLAVLTVFRRWGYTFAEACACTLVTVLMLLSCLFQLAYISGFPVLTSVAEILICILAAVTIVRNAAVFGRDIAAAPRFFKDCPIAGPIIAIAWCYLGLVAFFIPQQPSHWHNLSQVLLFERQGSFFLWSISDPSIAPHTALSPVNITILPHLFLRSHTDFGVGLIGLMAYLSIGFSTYALARRYAWPPTAITVTILVISMPRLVYQATTPGYELLPAAVALFCLLAVYRAIESPNINDICFLGLGLLFMISGSAVTLIFPIILIPLSCLLLFRRHGFIIWWKLIEKNRRTVFLALVPALVFSQIWLLAYNRYYGDAWFGTPDLSPVVLNTDGIQGTLANLIRYLLESAHFTQPVDIAGRWIAGFSISELWQSIYRGLVTPLLGDRGAAAPFQIVWLPDERLAWFGPFGFLLVLPAVANAAIRASRRLKAIAVALVGYLFLIALILAWAPGNARYFTVFFVCAGFCIAFLLPPWRISKRSRRGLQIAGGILLLYAGVYNTLQPAVESLLNSPGGTFEHRGSTINDQSGIRHHLPTGSAWSRSAWERDRYEPANRLFGDHRIRQMAALIPEGESVLIVYQARASLLPFLLMFPEASLSPVSTFSLDHIRQQPGDSPDYLIWADVDPPAYHRQAGINILRQAQPESRAPGGALWQVHHYRQDRNKID